MVQTLFGSEKSTPGLLDRMRRAVASTKAQLVERLEEITEGNPEIDPSLLDELEATLLSADLGVKTTQAILAAIRERVSRRQLQQASELTAAVKQEILSMLKGSGQDAKEPGASEGGTSEEQRLDVIFVIGVNGVGKTTSIAKLARYWQAEGHPPLLAAADTFRAAATEQLEIWANRLGVELVKQKSGADPAAVVFDALTAARTRKLSPVIVDTAGRLHTKHNLMAELAKMCRIAGREVAGAPHQILLVIDATTGQNGLAQARQFADQVGVTGVVLAKLDGTAKGGVVVSIAHEMGLPIRFVGVGEQVEDIIPFHPSDFVRSLFEA